MVFFFAKTIPKTLVVTALEFLSIPTRGLPLWYVSRFNWDVQRSELGVKL